MHRLPLLFLVLLAFLSTVGHASAPERQDCVLDADGSRTCLTALPLPAAARPASAPPCARNDFVCWCVLAVKYTNDVRRRKGTRKMLRVGPQRQLDNALRYAKALARLGKLRHQNLIDATKDVGCSRWMGGENIAFNYEPNDIAMRAVQQWVGSPGHLKNIVRDWFEDCVVGFYFAPDGRVYAVQTFSLVHGHGTFGSVSGPGCKPVGAGKKNRDDSRPRGSPRPSPEALTENERLRREGNRSCRCLEKGTDCWHSLREKSGYRCVPFRRTTDQPLACKKACCEYCAGHPLNGSCTNGIVRRLCNAM